MLSTKLAFGTRIPKTFLNIPAIEGGTKGEYRLRVEATTVVGSE